MSGRKLARRACDACKVRKIKCTETSPCDGCQHAGIPCTWLKQAQPRGPRRLRDATLQEIRKAQDILHTQSQEAARRGTSRSVNVNDPDPPPQPSSEVAHVVLYLCVYRVQLYPIWPVIKVERLIASLQSESPDVEVFALAYALAAATATRTQSIDLNVSRRNHAQVLEEKCQAARAKVPQGRPPNLTTVRIAFFLHVYYESLEANSMKSMLYLREAVTISTMIGLHKESYYLEVPAQEREIRRRVLWLLFVTERVISVLYEQPITLRTKIELPSTMDTDEIDVLVGFRGLVKLFWGLDEAGLFNFLDELDVQASPSSSGLSTTSVYPANYANLIEDTNDSGYIPPVQALDLAITRSWLHVMNLRIQQAFATEIANNPEHALFSLLASTEAMIESIEKSPYALLEAHGSALQLKILTIAGAFQGRLPPLASSPTYPEMHQRYTNLSAMLERALMEKAEKGPNLPSSKPESSAKSPKSFACSPTLNPLQPRSNGDVQLASNHQGSIPRCLSQDFAVTNNYEGLFDAVEIAGVQSSDSVEDLFSNANLEHYSTFDDGWTNAQVSSYSVYTTEHWQPYQRSTFDFE